MKPIEFSNNTDKFSEELTEFGTGQYTSARYLEERTYSEASQTNARHVIRNLKGSFVIFAKSSFYNYSSFAYDGRHNEMNAFEFRNFIEEHTLKTFDIFKNL